MFSYEQGERLAEVFNRWGVKSPENGSKLIEALRELGSLLTPELAAERPERAP